MNFLERQVNFKVIGTTPERPDGIEKVTGRARFADDIHLPRMLFGKILRSPHAHAIIKSIDTSKATAIPGVHGTLTGLDFPKLESTIRVPRPRPLGHLRPIRSASSSHTTGR